MYRPLHAIIDIIDVAKFYKSLAETQNEALPKPLLKRARSDNGVTSLPVRAHASPPGRPSALAGLARPV